MGDRVAELEAQNRELQERVEALLESEGNWQQIYKRAVEEVDEYRKARNQWAADFDAVQARVSTLTKRVHRLEAFIVDTLMREGREVTVGCEEAVK